MGLPTTRAPGEPAVHFEATTTEANQSGAMPERVCLVVKCPRPPINYPYDHKEVEPSFRD